MGVRVYWQAIAAITKPTMVLSVQIRTKPIQVPAKTGPVPPAPTLIELVEASQPPADLAEMLGVRRTSVSTVAHTLQQAGFLKYARGRIHIVNLEGLQESACECYSTVCRHYDTMLGVGNNK
jgi:hypothetical protein